MKLAAILGITVLIALTITYGSASAGFGGDEDPNYGYPFVPTIHDQWGATPGTVKLTRNMFFGDIYDDLHVQVYWEGRALNYHPNHEMAAGGSVEWPADQLEFELETGACRNNNGYIVYRVEFSYGGGNVVNWPGKYSPWWDDLGQFIHQRWEGAYTHLQSECYDHPSDIPLSNNNVFSVAYRDWRPKQIDAFMTFTNSLPTTYDLEVQLVEWGRQGDPNAYRTRVITDNRSVFQVTFFYADQHQLKNLQLYLIRVRAYDPADGRTSNWSNWKEIYYFGFDRAWLHSLLPRDGVGPVTTQPAEPDVVLNEAGIPFSVDPIVELPTEADLPAETVERIAQAAADAEAASAPDTGPAPGEEYEDLEEIEHQEREAEEEEQNCECAVFQPIDPGGW